MDIETEFCLLLDKNIAEGIKTAHEYTEKGVMTVVKIQTILRNKGYVQELVRYSMKHLKDETPDSMYWQTYILEKTLETHPYLAELAFTKTKWEKFDRQKIGKQFQSKGFHQHALRCYKTPEEIMSVIRNIHAISEDFLIEYFGTQPNYIVFDIFELLLKHNTHNKSTVINIASANIDKLGIIPVLSVFEKMNDDEGAYQYLNEVIDSSYDKQVYTSFIEKAMATENYFDVDRIFKNRWDLIDGLRTKKSIYSKKWDNQDDHGLFHHFVESFGWLEEYIRYMCKFEMWNHQENYACKIAPSQGHLIVPAMIDNHVRKEDLLRKIIDNIKDKTDKAMLHLSLKQRGVEFLVA